MPTALTVGNVSFNNFEVPEEIDHFGGEQRVVVHDFPGGERDVQTFGWFPPEVVSWSAIFWEDSPINGFATDVYDRIQQVQDIVRLGQPVTLEFARFSYEVLLWKLELKPKLEKMIPYTIHLIPISDNNNPAGPPTAPPIQQLSQVANNLGTAPGSPLTAPPIPANNPLVNNLNPNITQANPLTVPDPIPANVASALTSFQTSLNNGIQQALGNVNHVNSPALQAQLNQTQALVAPLAASANDGFATFGLYTSAGLATINNILNPTPQEPLATINAVNPDLMDLALQWYGNADKWTEIAEANDLVIPNPIGIFAAPVNPIIIPALS